MNQQSQTVNETRTDRVADDAIPPYVRQCATAAEAGRNDLFDARVPLEFIQQVFRAITETPQHTYQVLTKRSTRLRRLASKLDWPPNLWIGVSVENAEVLYRVDDLRQVPAAVRFLSCEPLVYGGRRPVAS